MEALNTPIKNFYIMLILDALISAAVSVGLYGLTISLTDSAGAFAVGFIFGSVFWASTCYGSGCGTLCPKIIYPCYAGLVVGLLIITMSAQSFETASTELTGYIYNDLQYAQEEVLTDQSWYYGE